MATIGLSKPYVAVYENVGNKIKYTKGGVIGKAVELSVELEGGDTNILYADNGPAESDSQFAGGSLAITTDDLDAESMMKYLGLKTEAISIDGVSTTDAKWIVYDADQNIPYLGFGAILKKKIAGKYKYVAIALLKIQFANPGTAAVTQGESIEWQTSELSATIMRSDNEKGEWQRISTPLDTEAEAELVLKSLFNITEPLTPTLSDREDFENEN